MTENSTTRNSQIASEIRAEMARQRITGREMARRIGKPDTTVARWLRGVTGMTFDEIDELARALDVSAVDLVIRAFGQGPTTGPARAVNSGWRSRCAPVRSEHSVLQLIAS